MPEFRVDLRCDTVSVPSDSMRGVMARAEVGDDVFGEDPTINKLENLMAEMSGFDSAVFMPTGTMSNGVAVRAIASAGDEVICGSRSHVYLYEGAQYAASGGIQMHRIDEDADGCLPYDEVTEALSGRDDIHCAPRTLITLEDTHNIMGGLILPRRDIRRIQALADESDVSVYLDGARLWHVLCVNGQPLKNLVSGFRMVSLCFSKALGCPVGSILLCSEDDEERVRRLRKLQGGGMRQAGILAAACLYAIDNNLPRLRETHDYAAVLADGIVRSDILSIATGEVDTNIILMRVPEGRAQSVVSALEELEIGTLAISPSIVRLVTHISLEEKHVKYAADVLSAFGGIL